MAACDSALDLVADGQRQGNGYAISSRTGEIDEFTGSCGQAPGSDRVVAFTAPAGGQWLFETAGEEIDTLLYVRSTCSDAGSELACNDDVGGGPLTSSVLLDLNANQTVFLVVDQFESLAAAAFELSAQQADFSAPTINEADSIVVRDGDSLSIELHGADADGDAATLAISLLDAGGNPIDIGDGNTEGLLDGTPEWNGDRFIMLLTVNVGGYMFEDVRIAVEDLQGLRSQAIDWIPDAPTQLRVGDVCNPLHRFGVCPEGSECYGDEPTCQVANAPVLQAADVYYTLEGGALAVVATGSDADDDMVAIQIELFDEAGESLGAGDLPIDANEDAAMGSRLLSTSVPVDLEGLPAWVEVRILDSAGTSSNIISVEQMRVPVEVAAGERCNVAGNIAACADGLACVGDTFYGSCGDAVLSCPGDWPQIDLNAAGLRYEGDTSMSANLGGVGTCGGGGNQDLLVYEAPAAGTYTFTIVDAPEGSDTLLFARTHCGVQGAEFELACNDDLNPDILLSSVSLDLDRDQRIYLFVDGYNGGFANTYTLEVVAE